MIFTLKVDDFVSLSVSILRNKKTTVVNSAQFFSIPLICEIPPSAFGFSSSLSASLLASSSLLLFVPPSPSSSFVASFTAAIVVVVAVVVVVVALLSPFNFFLHLTNKTKQNNNIRFNSRRICSSNIQCRHFETKKLLFSMYSSLFIKKEKKIKVPARAWKERAGSRQIASHAPILSTSMCL